jgi:L-ascorbate metabolism protein UlaG (beta-lactamase superfamily)
VDVVYLGQSGLTIAAAGAAIAIDPYLSSSVERAHPAQAALWRRAFSPPVDPQHLDVDAVCCTHAHDDHCDPETVRPWLDTHAGVVHGPGPVVRQLETWNRGDRGRLLRVGERSEIARGIFVTAVPSAHYEFDRDADGQPACLGLVVEAGGRSLYHAGDSLAYHGLAASLAAWRLDVACLPVNGRSPDREARGIVGNMTAREAAALARALGDPLVVPLHNDLFAANSVPWSDVEDAFSGLRLRKLAPGARLSLAEWAAS